MLNVGMTLASWPCGKKISFSPPGLGYFDVIMDTYWSFQVFIASILTVFSYKSLTHWDASSFSVWWIIISSLHAENATCERSSIANMGTRLNSKRNYGLVSREIIGRMNMDILEWCEVIIFVLTQYSWKANKVV